MKQVVCAITAVLCMVDEAALGDDPANLGTPRSVEARAVTWLANFAEAKAGAQRQRKPLLVRFETSGSPWCAKLAETLERADLRAELGRWVLLSLSADEPTAVMRTLGVATTPALRTMSPAGLRVGSYDGYLPAEQLKAWLHEQYDQATATPRAELLAADRPDLVGVTRLVADFRARDAVAREAALRRLLPYPDLAAGPVTETFVTGTLQARLAALELLQAWQAPLADLDPWQPESLTKPRLALLRAWALRPNLKSNAEPTPRRGVPSKKTWPA